MRRSVAATLVLGALAGTSSVACENTAEDCAKLGTCTGGGGAGATGGGGAGATGGGGIGGAGGGGMGGAGGETTSSSTSTTTTTAPCETQKVKRFGDGADQAAFTLAAGPADLVVAGSFTGALKFGAADLAAPGPGPSGFFSRFTGDLSPGVSRQLDARYMAGAVDESGAFVAAGTQSAALDLGCGSVGFDVSYPLALFVVKYDANGTCHFHVAFGATGITSLSVAAGASDTVAVAGGFEGMLAIGADPPLTSAGGVDIFAARITGGALSWRYANGAAGDDQARAVAIHSDGTFVVAGDHGGGLDFSLGDPTVTTGGFPAPFLMTLQGDMLLPQVAWARSFQLNNGASARVAALAVDTSDAAAPAIVLSGDLTATTAAGVKLVPSIPGEPAVNLQSPKHGLFAARFALGPAGKLLAHKSYPGLGEAASDDMGIGGMAVDAEGRVLLGGWLNQSLQLADGVELTSPGGMVSFMAVLDAALAHRKSLTLGSVGGENQAFGAAFFKGDAILAGRYTGTLDVFGETAPSMGGDDLFVVRLCAE